MSGILPPRQHEAHAIASLVELTLMDPDPRTHDFNESQLAAARVVLPWIRRAGLDGWERADGPKVRVASRRRPKPDPPELVAAKAEVRARSMGRCEAHVTGWCSLHAGHAHHVLGRGQGGAHTAENLADVCPNCHTKIHANPEWARRHGLMRSPGGPLIAPVSGCPLSCEVDHRPITGPA